MPRSNVAFPIFGAKSATVTQASDLSVIGVAVAADATAQEPQITTFVGGTYSRQDAIRVTADTTIDGQTLTPGLWYFPQDTAAGAATVNDLVKLPSGGANPVIRYTSDGAIQDSDHVAIFEPGAVNMTLATASVNRRIVVSRTSAVDVNIIDSSGQEFTAAGGVTTDQTIVVNQSYTRATLLNNGSGWEVLV